MLEALHDIDWSRYPQPPRNSADEVPASLRALADPADLDRERAYHRFLYALGNSHAGTYFPVAVPASSFVCDILRDGALVARLRALDALIDLLGSFWPDPDCEVVASEQGPQLLKDVLLATVKGRRQDVALREQNAESAEERKLALELLELLDE